MKLVARFDDFFEELDAAWSKTGKGPVTLRIIGASALLLQTGYDRGTIDSDVLETNDLDADTKQTLLALAGKGSVLHVRHKIHLQLVANGLPFLPQSPLFHRHPSDFAHLVVLVLDPVDVVVSKLKVFRQSDVADIDRLISQGLAPHARVVERFRAAVDWHAFAADADAISQCIDNLHAIERDSFDVAESSIDLPLEIDD
ncbi:MAG TPA: DUF6036 family nucleotidyltransferase [Polyangiaceae bacterium]